MFHTNKMPKIIVFRVVIEGTAPTEGSPTACHRKRPSCPKHLSARLLVYLRTPERLHPACPPAKAIFGRIFAPVCPATGSALPVPSTPSARLLVYLRTPERLHPASTPAKAIFGRIFAPVCPATGSVLPVPSAPSARLLVYLRTPERPHPASPPAKAIFGRIFAPVYSFKLRLL